MRNWTVRTRIIAAFAAIIAIVAALGAVSLVELGGVRTQATLLQTDVLPGLLLSSQASAQAKTLLPSVLTLATGTDEQEKTRARDQVKRALAEGLLAEQRYRPTITAEDDRLLFDSMVSTRTRLGDTYATAMRDKTLDANEVSTQLRPLIHRDAALPLAVLLLSQPLHGTGERLDERTLSALRGSPWCDDRDARVLVPGAECARAHDGPARLRCGNPDPTSTHGKAPAGAKRLELQGWGAVARGRHASPGTRHIRTARQRTSGSAPEIA